MRIALRGPPSEHRDVVAGALRSRDVSLVKEEDRARLIVFVGPLDESPYSGCDNDVRVLPTSESKQATRLKALRSLRVFDRKDAETSVHSRGTASEDGPSGEERSYRAFAREREASDGGGKG